MKTINWQKYKIVHSSLKSVKLNRIVDKRDLKAISKLHGLAYEVVEELNEINLKDFENRIVVKADRA